MDGRLIGRPLVTPQFVILLPNQLDRIHQVNDQVIIRVELATFLGVQHSVKQGQPAEEVGCGSG